MRDHKELQLPEQEHCTKLLWFLAQSNTSHCQLELEEDRQTLKPGHKT